jgi:hypothetical protein
MKKIGKTFSRDMEFTGSADAMVGRESRMLHNLQQKGAMPEPIPRPAGTAEIRSSHFRFPEVKGYMEGIQEKSAVVELNDQQKKQIKEVTGWSPSKLEVSVTSTERSRDIALTKEQQEAIDDAVGLKVASVNVSRDPIEVTFK